MENEVLRSVCRIQGDDNPGCIRLCNFFCEKKFNMFNRGIIKLNLIKTYWILNCEKGDLYVRFI